jgi:hypothetical protein
MLRKSNHNHFDLLIDKIVFNAVKDEDSKESFGDSDGYGFYALVELPKDFIHKYGLNDDEIVYLASHPWAILSQDCYQCVAVRYFESKESACQQWTLERESYDQYTAEQEWIFGN